MGQGTRARNRPAVMRQERHTPCQTCTAVLMLTLERKVGAAQRAGLQKAPDASEMLRRPVLRVDGRAGPLELSRASRRYRCGGGNGGGKLTVGRTTDRQTPLCFLCFGGGVGCRFVLFRCGMFQAVVFFTFFHVVLPVFGWSFTCQIDSGLKGALLLVSTRSGSRLGIYRAACLDW